MVKRVVVREEEPEDRVQELTNNTADLVEDLGDLVRASLDATIELTASWVTIFGDSITGLTRRRSDTRRRSRTDPDRSDRSLGAGPVDFVRDLVDVVQDS